MLSQLILFSHNAFYIQFHVIRFHSFENNVQVTGIKVELSVLYSKKKPDAVLYFASESTQKWGCAEWEPTWIYILFSYFLLFNNQFQMLTAMECFPIEWKCLSHQPENVARTTVSVSIYKMTFNKHDSIRSLNGRVKSIIIGI